MNRFLLVLLTVLMACRVCGAAEGEATPDPSPPKQIAILANSWAWSNSHAQPPPLASGRL